MSGTLKVEDGMLVFELHGADKILSVKRRIQVPLENVVSVSTEKASWAPFRQLRVIGASLPGVVKDGTFITGDGYVFFEMRNPDKCITVTLDHEKYRKIVFEVEDKDSAARMVNEALRRRRSG
jgi:hypothetical protein